MEHVSIGRTCEAGLSACLALLAPIVNPDTVIFEARTAGGDLVGASGLMWQSWGSPPGFPVWACVLPDHRRRGIGTALVDRIIEQAKGETANLWVAAPVSENTAAANFALHMGFMASHRQLFFRADLAQFLAHLEVVVGNLRRRGRIPDGISILALTQAPLDDITTLVMRELRDAPIDLPSRIRTSRLDDLSSPIDLSRSLAVIHHGDVVGALLVRRAADGNNVQIVANVVSRALRGGWANAVLLEATTRRSLEAGSVWFDFDCGDDIRDTIGLAQRGKADLLRSECLFHYALTADEA